MPPLTINCRGTGTSGQVELTTESTFRELLVSVDAKLKLGLGDAGLSSIRVLAGFPPKALELADGEAIGGQLSNKETVRIESKVKGAAVAAAAEPKASSKKKGKTPAASTGSKKRANAPAKAATAQSTSPTKSPVAKSPIAAVAGRSFGAKVHTLAGPVSSSSPTAKRRRKTAVSMGGSAEELGSKLVGAMQPGNGEGGKEVAFWRRVMTNAVGSQYESTKAVDRVTASRAGTWASVADPEGGYTASGSAAAMKVTFPCAASKRRPHVDAGLVKLSKQELVAVLREVLASSSASDREMLKPENMALCSPRVFWAAVQLSGGRPIEEALPRLLAEEGGAGLDWGFLSTRARSLSAKAKENQAQLEAAERAGVEDAEDAAEGDTADEEAAAASPAAEPSRGEAARAARARAAEAAERRLVAGAPVPASLPMPASLAVAPPGGLPAVDPTEPTWQGAPRVEGEEEGEGDLASVVGEDMADKVASCLAISAAGCGLAALADADADALRARLGSTCASGAPVSLGAVQRWVAAARESEDERCLRDVLGGDEGVASILKGALKVHGVRDLKLWAKRPAIARAMAARYLARAAARDPPADADAAQKLSDQAFAAWGVAADAAVAERPWLDHFITGVFAE